MDDSYHALDLEEKVEEEGVLELSETLLKDVLDDLDHVETSSGLRDAYKSQSVDYLVPLHEPESSPGPAYERLYSAAEDSDNVAQKPFYEAWSDQQNALVSFAQEEVAKVREGHNMNRPYVRLDNKLDDTKFSIIIKEGHAYWQFLYEVSGSIQAK